MLEFLADRNELKDRHLELIWQCTADKYLKDATFEEILSTCTHWDSPSVKYIWKKIGADSPKYSEWTLELVDFLFKLLSYDPKEDLDSNSELSDPIYSRTTQYGRAKNALTANDTLATFWHAMEDDSSTTPAPPPPPPCLSHPPFRGGYPCRP